MADPSPRSSHNVYGTRVEASGQIAMSLGALLPPQEPITRNRRARAERAATLNASTQAVNLATLPPKLTCAVCAQLVTYAPRHIVVDGVTREIVILASHTADDDAWNTEDGGLCAGGGYPPLDLSPQAAVDLLHRKDALYTALGARETHLRRHDLAGMSDLHGRWGPKGLYISADDPRFPRVLEIELADIEMLRAQIAASVEQLRARCTNWLREDIGRALPKSGVRTGYTRLHRDPAADLATLALESTLTASRRRAAIASTQRTG